MTLEEWTIVIGFGTLVVTVAGFGLAIVMLVRSIQKGNDLAHSKIEKNIKDSNEGLKNEFNAKFNDLKDSNKGLKDEFNVRFDDLKDYIKLAMRVKDKD